MPQGARPQVARPRGGCGGCARHGLGCGQYDFEPCGGDFAF
jgi:hypothetical protein